MKLVIHAGIHRTGTTSLQGFLAENREFLLQRGVSYPGEAVNHQQLAWAIKRGAACAADVERLVLSGANAEVVVLSAEDFCIHTNLEWLKSIAGTFETHVVFYVRRQDHWVMSWYNQHVKWPFDRRKSQMSKAEFLASIGDFHWLDYASMLERWDAVLGRDRVGVSVIGPGQVANVIEDFLIRLKVPPDGMAVANPRKNDSLPVHIIEIARHLGLIDLPPKGRTRLLRALISGLAPLESGATTLFSPQERLSIIDRFEHSNRQTAIRLGGQGPLFLEPPPSPDEPWFDFPELPRDELLRKWIAPVIRQLLTP